MVNKQARVSLSQPLSFHSAITHRLFATANSRGWFAAVTNNGGSGAPCTNSLRIFTQYCLGLILSPLDDLRAAFKAAKDGNNDIFPPKRILSLPQGKPTIITFACNDTRLLVALEEGHVLAYDTAQLFSPGSEEIQPGHVFQSQSGAPLHMSPNPGTEQNLVDHVAVLRGDGAVQLLNMQMQSQGGWAGSDPDSTPVAGLSQRLHGGVVQYSL